MHYDLAKIPAGEAYKLLVATVVPRPIALTTTIDRAGRVNAAPFSFFNARLRLIGRMHGRGWYARTTDLFDMPRLSRADWEAGKEK
jgi:hypothetical protein